MTKKPKPKLDFKDISLGLRILREFLLGRPHELKSLHVRFPPMLAPRTIPRPDIPRGPDPKYSQFQYCTRSAQRSVKPPVIAPVGEGSKPGSKHIDPAHVSTNISVMVQCWS